MESDNHHPLSADDGRAPVLDIYEHSSTPMTFDELQTPPVGAMGRVPSYGKTPKTPLVPLPKQSLAKSPENLQRTRSTKRSLLPLPKKPNIGTSLLPDAESSISSVFEAASSDVEIESTPSTRCTTKTTISPFISASAKLPPPHSSHPRQEGVHIGRNAVKGLRNAARSEALQMDRNSLALSLQEQQQDVRTMPDKQILSSKFKNSRNLMDPPDATSVGCDSDAGVDKISESKSKSFKSSGHLEAIEGAGVASRNGSDEETGTESALASATKQGGRKKNVQR